MIHDEQGLVPEWKNVMCKKKEEPDAAKLTKAIEYRVADCLQGRTLRPNHRFWQKE